MRYITFYEESEQLIIDYIKKHLESEIDYMKDTHITLNYGNIKMSSMCFKDIFEMIHILFSDEMKHYIYILHYVEDKIKTQFFQKSKLDLIRKLKYANKYIFFNFYHVTCNFIRIVNGYYYSVKKNVFKIKEDYKISNMCLKLRYIMNEYERYLNMFFKEFVEDTLKSSKSYMERAMDTIYKCFYKESEIYLSMRINRNFNVFKNPNFLYIPETNEYIEKSVSIVYPYLNVNIYDMYTFFLIYVSKYYPNMTNEYGIPYEISYVPIPLFE